MKSKGRDFQTQAHKGKDDEKIQTSVKMKRLKENRRERKATLKDGRRYGWPREGPCLNRLYDQLYLFCLG